MSDNVSPAEAAALLAWWREMGVDDVLDEVPTDWLGRADRPPGADIAIAATAPEPASRAAPPSASPVAVPHAGARAALPTAPAPPRAEARRFPSAPPDAATTAARRLAREAPDLAALGAALATFDGCGLKATAKSLCFYRGSPRARLMIVGEAPGREEDLEGRPFVGRAGKLLDRMLAAIGLGEGDVHITNVVYWRPPGNRTPTPLEVQVCRPFLERQIEFVAPEIVLTLGGPASKALLGTEEGIMRVRGRWRDVEIGNAPVALMPTLHPAYLLRTPAAKRLAWRDLLAIKARLETPAQKGTR